MAQPHRISPTRPGQGRHGVATPPESFTGSATPFRARLAAQLLELLRLWLYVALVNLLRVLTGWSQRVDPRSSTTNPVRVADFAGMATYVDHAVPRGTAFAMPAGYALADVDTVARFAQARAEQVRRG